MKTPWLCFTAAVALAAACTRTEARAVQTESARVSKVVLIANLGEADEECGCGQIIRAVRSASTRGIPTHEIDTRTADAETKTYRAVVAPTVVMLDANGTELRRYEGEGSEVLKRLNADLEKAVASGK